VDNVLIAEVKAGHPDMCCALVTNGRGMDERGHDDLSGIDLVMEDQGATDKIVKAIEKCLCKKTQA